MTIAGVGSCRPRPCHRGRADRPTTVFSAAGTGNRRTTAVPSAAAVGASPVLGSVDEHDAMLFVDLEDHAELSPAR